MWLHGERVDTEVARTVRTKRGLGGLFCEHQRDYFSDIVQGLVKCLALRVTPLKRGAFNNIKTINTTLYQDRKLLIEALRGLLFHRVTIACVTDFKNCPDYS